MSDYDYAAELLGGKKADSAKDYDYASELLGSKQQQALPSPSFMDSAVRGTGLAVRAGIKGAAAIPSMVGDVIGLDSSNVVDSWLDKVLPRPENALERIGMDVGGAVAGTGVLGKLAGAVKPAGTLASSVLQQFSSNLGGQALASAGAGAASGTTREMGGGPGAQFVAGLAGGVAAPMAVSAVRNLPGNMLAKRIQQSEKTPFAAEGQRLRDATGINLSPGAETGNKLLLGLENTARQYGPVADRLQDVDVKIANQAINRVTTIADKISSRKVDPVTLGSEIEETVKSAARSIATARDRTAGVDYGRVRELAGDTPVIKLKNFADELRGLIDEYKNVAGADAQKIATQSAAALQRITGEVVQGTTPSQILGPNGAPLVAGSSAVKGTINNTITEAMKTRRFYGQASRGAANVFDDIAPNINRQIGARLFGAINKDFDESAVNAGGALRDVLNKANGNYKKFSQSIEFLERSTLGKLIGDDLVDAAISGAKTSTTAGEAVIQKLMTTYPSSRKAAIEILNQWNPQLTKDLRATVLRDALDKGMSIPPSAKGAGQVPLSFNKFISALQGEKVGFDKQLASYGFNKAEIADIKDTVSAMMRAGDRTGFNYSNTGVMQQNMEIAEAVGQGAVGNVKTAASKALSIGGKYFGLDKVAKAMESPAGRQALKTLVSPKASPQAVLAAFETVDKN